MFALWRRHKAYRERVAREAEAVVARYGEAAYDFARSRRIETLKLQNRADYQFWCAVARMIADQTGREIGVDTATRYGTSPRRQRSRRL